MKRITSAAAIMLAAFLTVPVIADNHPEFQKEVDKFMKLMDPERFQLAYQCRDVAVYVEIRGSQKEFIVPKEMIETTVKNILRDAQIYSDYPEGRPVLFIKIQAIKEGFHLGIHLVGHATRDEIVEGEGMVLYAAGDAITWFKGGTFPNFQNPAIALHAITKLTEHFVDEYLRVNAEDCD